MKSFFILLVFCLTSTLSNAQDVKFGIRMGTGLAWYNSSEKNVVQPDGSKLNFTFGLTGEYLFSDNYALTAGLGLGFGQGGSILFKDPTVIVKDTDLKGDDVQDLRGEKFPADTKVDYSITQVEIPLSLKLRTNEIGYFTYFAELPIVQFDIRTSARADFEGPGISSSDENISDEIYLFNVRWGAGAGVEYHISDETFATAGFYFTSATIDSHEVEGSKVRPNRFNLKVGILF